MRRIVLVCALALGGCDGAAPELKVSDAWARATSAATSSAAVYMTISNHGGRDRLTSIATPAAKAAALHTMTMDGSVMRMRPATDGVEVPAGGSISLAPSGIHVMLTGLERSLVAGQRIPARLRFAQSGYRNIAIKVVGAGTR